MAVETSAPKSRRSFLAAGLGGIGALIVGAVARPEAARAADGDPVTLGNSDATNQATAVTLVENTTAGGTSLAGKSSGAGIGLAGTSATGQGARAQSTDATPTPDFSVASHRSGSVGVAGDATNVATNTDETGVYGFADVSANSTGVWGDTINGIGVVGSGDWGVYGVGSIGVYAEGTVALRTVGKLQFSGRSGHRAITSGHSYVDVAIPGMTSGSDVIATLRTRRTGYYIAAVASYTGKFRVYLNKTATSTIYVNYLVLN